MTTFDLVLLVLLSVKIVASSVRTNLLLLVEHDKLSETKEGGLIREPTSNIKPTFYPCTVFRQPRPLPEGALWCHWSAADCTVYYRTGEVTKYTIFIF